VLFVFVSLAYLVAFVVPKTPRLRPLVRRWAWSSSRRAAIDPRFRRF
jgi:hypothetical protein